MFIGCVNSLTGDRARCVDTGLPENYSAPDYRPVSEPPCIIELLCERHEGLAIEAKGIKEHWWKPYVKKLFDKKVCWIHRVCS